MFDTVIVKLEQFIEIVEFTTLAQLVGVIIWVGIIRTFKLSYRVSLLGALVLVLLSMFSTIFGLDSAGFIAEIAFLLLASGVIQLVFHEQ